LITIDFKQPLKIGILGTRGIPNAYGGFEQFAQYLSVGLATRGHSVWVYSSSDHPYRESEWKGVHIIHCKDWESRIGTAGQFLYDYNCLKDARKRGFDVLYQLGYTSNSIWNKLWPKDALNVINMDGLEWKRDKYGPLTRQFLLKAERWAVRHGDLLIADSVRIKDYLDRKYDQHSVFIPYGAVIPRQYAVDVPERWGLVKNHYFLAMARMEPENNIEMIIRGWLRSGESTPLVLIGNTANSFGRHLLRTYRHKNLLFLGAIYDESVVNALRHHSSGYFHGHSVGGTNPSLLEAMAGGCMIFAHDNPFNMAVLGDDAAYFSSAAGISRLLEHMPEPEQADGWKQRNIEKIRSRYTWERIVDRYDRLFGEHCLRKRTSPATASEVGVTFIENIS
jgi:glycosyltransferase involved in cell wall biosynthesis